MKFNIYLEGGGMYKKTYYTVRTIRIILILYSFQKVIPLVDLHLSKKEVILILATYQEILTFLST